MKRVRLLWANRYDLSTNREALHAARLCEPGKNGTFCGAPHPDNPDPETDPDNFDYHFCRRIKGHPGDGHRAFTHSISTPETW